MQFDKKKTILLVEDEFLLAMNEKSQLIKYGYNVIAVNSGENAVEAMNGDSSIDLILMDINLGSGIDGTKAAEQILKDHDIPIVFLSSHIEPDVVEKTEKITSYGYVVKNSSITVLDASIKMAFKLSDANKKTMKLNSKYEATLDAIPDLMFEIGIDGTYHDVHAPHPDLLVTPSAEMLIGKRIHDFLPAETAAIVMSAIAEANEKGLSAGRQYELAVEGGLRWFEISVSRMSDLSPDPRFIYICRDITEGKRMEEALEKRILLLTSPLDASDAIAFTDLFSIREIQKIQDDFSTATGVASIITQVDGTPITSPSNFCRLCSEIVRKSEMGNANCMKSDAVLGKLNSTAPLIQNCLSGGLWDAGTSITVGGKHIANWLIGQVRDETQTEEGMVEYARKIGVDEQEFIEAFREVPVMTREKFGQIASTLFGLAYQLSTLAYQNVQQARLLAERKKMEEELRFSEGKYRNLFNKAEVGMLRSRLDGSEVLECNGKILSILGKTRDEVIGKPASVLWADSNERVEMVKVLHARGHVDELECHLLRKDGKIITCITSLKLYPETGILEGSIIDITERKELENSLQQKERRLQAVFNAMTEGFSIQEVITDEFGKPVDLRFVDANPAFEAQTGLKNEETFGHTLRELFPTAEQYWIERYGKVGLTGEPISFEAQFSPLGKYYHVSAFQTEPKQFGVLFMDIAEARAAREETRKNNEMLRESDSRLKSLVVDMSVGVLIQGPDAEILMSNPQALELLGLSEDQLLGKTSFDPDWNVVHEDGSSFPGANHPVPQAIASLAPVRDVVMGVYRPTTENRVWLKVDAIPHIEEGKLQHVVCTFIDISKRIQAEGSLRDSEAMHARMISNTSDVIGIIGADRIMKYKSPNIERWFGWRPEEVIGTDGFLNVHPDDLDRIRREFSGLIQENNASTTIECRYRCKDGTYKPIELTAKNLLDDSVVGGVLLNYHDITHRRKAEAELLEMQTILKAAIDNSSAGIAIADAPDGTLRYVNDAGLLIRGGTRDTVVNGIGIDKYVASWKLFDFDGRPLDPDEVPLARAIKFGETNSRSFFIRRIEGDDRAVVANASPIRDVEGNIVAAIVVFQDITEQKKAEERMRSSEERLTLATEAGNIGIWDWNVQNDILVWDDSMYRLYGVRKEEFGGVYEAWSRTVLPEDRTYADGEIQAAIRGEREYDIEHRIVRPDGTVRVIAVSAKILRGKDGKAKRMIGTNIDITDRKEAETRIVKLLSEKETLLREVHHRMKNNMNTIQSLLALQAEFAHDPTVAAALDDARNRLRSMEILYDKLYRVERYDAISANDYLPALVKEIVSVFPNSDLVEVTTEVGDFMLAPRQMTAVGILVNEIVTNSMKYAFRSRGGGCIFLTAALTERRVRIAIRDDGVGFPSDVDIGNSKGFGMTLVGGLAKQLGGSIRIERGQGTTFVLEFEAEKV